MKLFLWRRYYLKRLVNLLLAISLLVILSSCNTNESNVNFEPNDYTLLVKPNNTLGFSLFNHVEADDNNNIFISPTSALMAMLMAYNGADGETKTEIEQALQLHDFSVQKVNEANAALMAILAKHEDNITLATANSLWLNNQYQLQADFAENLHAYYNAEVAEIDITDNNSANLINNWVKKQTNDKIDQIVEAPLPGDLLAYIINALYFNGSWTYEFDKNRTGDSPFYSDSKEVKIPFMELEKELPYFETDTFQAVKLPYGEGEMSMQLYLPNEEHSLENFLENITEKDWIEWQENFAETEGTVRLPKFEIEYETDLNEALQSLGIRAAFDEAHADFSNMIEGNNQIHISKVKQKTYINVHEEGTEAAAVTVVEVRETSAILEDHSFYMELNRPFFFTISDEKSGTILFMGAIHHPNVK